MQLGSRRTLAVAGAALALIGGGAAAAATQRGGQGTPPEKQAFLDSVAKHLGVTSDVLQGALKAAALERVDALVAAGTITKDQADTIKARIAAGKLAGPFGFGGHHGFRGGFGDELSAAADYLGLSAADLGAQLRGGKSLADVAKAQGKSVDGLQKALVAAEKAKLDQAVKDGKLTADQEKTLLDKLSSRIADLVNGTLPTHRGGFRGHGFGGHSFGGWPGPGATGPTVQQ